MSEMPKSAAHAQAGRRVDARYLAVTAMLSAVAFALAALNFPVPFMPPFIKLDVSDLPSLLGAFSLGPGCGVLVALLKNVLNVLIEGSDTAFVGELSNFLLNAALAGSAGLIYKRRKDRTGAIVGSIAGAVLMGLISVPLNYFLVYPVYAAAFGGMETVVGAYQAILPSAGGLFECLVIFNLPFTVCKGLLCAALCFLSYKPLSPLLHGR